MAQSTLHFSLGMVTGTAVAMLPLVRAWRHSNKLAARFRNWLILSYGLGVLAVLPGILKRMGVPEEFCSGWWMNICMFHPLISRIKAGGAILGELAIATCFAAQYALLLLALHRSKASDHDNLNCTTRPPRLSQMGQSDISHSSSP